MSDYEKMLPRALVRAVSRFYAFLTQETLPPYHGLAGLFTGMPETRGRSGKFLFHYTFLILKNLTASSTRGKAHEYFIQSNEHHRWLDQHDDDFHPRHRRAIGENVTGVTTLEIFPRKHCSLALYQRSVNIRLPGLNEIIIQDSGSTKTSTSFNDLQSGFYGDLSEVTNVTWRHCTVVILISGGCFSRCPNLKELYLGECLFHLNDFEPGSHITSALDDTEINTRFCLTSANPVWSMCRFCEPNIPMDTGNSFLCLRLPL